MKIDDATGVQSGLGRMFPAVFSLVCVLLLVSCGGGGGASTGFSDYTGNYSGNVVLRSSTCATQPFDFDGVTFEVIQEEDFVRAFFVFADPLFGSVTAHGFEVSGEYFDREINCLLDSEIVAEETVYGIRNELSISMRISLISCQGVAILPCSADYSGTIARFVDSAPIRGGAALRSNLSSIR